MLYKTFTGHVTGNLVFMMVAVAHREWHGVAQRFLAVLVFFAGTRAGFLLAATRRSAGLLLLGQAALLLPLLFSATALTHFPTLGVALFCAALGLQNGVVTTIHNVSIHTTFVSGDFTKLLKLSPASSAGKQPTPAESAKNLVPWLIGGFVAGALAAASVQVSHPGAAIPVLLIIFALAFMTTTLPIMKQG